MRVRVCVDEWVESGARGRICRRDWAADGGVRGCAGVCGEVVVGGVVVVVVCKGGARVRVGVAGVWLGDGSGGRRAC